jgi:hypothetical protein
MPDDPKLINLDHHRIKLALEGKPGTPDLDTEPLAFVEAIWGPDVYGWNATTVDMEARRRGGEDMTLRPPETVYEAQLVVQHVRALANDIARHFGLGDLVREGDDL